MKIDNINIYGLEGSNIASELPKAGKKEGKEFQESLRLYTTRKNDKNIDVYKYVFEGFNYVLEQGIEMR